MNALRVWKRLLWKEFREGRFVVLLTALAPLVLFPMAIASGGYSVNSVMAVPAAAGVHLAIAFWGAGRGGSKRTGSEFSWTHLPTSPAIEWLASMVVPLLVIAGLGLWYGWLATSSLSNTRNTISMPVAGMIDLTTTFALCYLISMVISNWAAYLFGVFRLVGGTLISVWNLMPMLESDTVGFVTRTLAGSLLGAFVYVVLFRKRSVAFRQGFALIAVVATIFAPVVIDVGRQIAVIAPRAQKAGVTLDWLTGGYITDHLGKCTGQSDDGLLEIRPAGVIKGIYIDYALSRRGIQAAITHRFRLGTGVLSVLPDGRVYLGRPAQSGVGVDILEWDSRTDSVKKLLTMPIRGRLFNTNGFRSYISPDSRYMMLRLQSQLDSGTDFWVLDMQRGTSRLVVPSVPFHGDVWPTWGKDAVAVFDSVWGVMRIDLRTYEVKRLQLPDEEVSE